MRGEPYIEFRTQCVIMTLAGEGWGGEGGEVRGVIANDVLKLGKVIEFQSS